jgi:UPF0271 protein
MKPPDLNCDLGEHESRETRADLMEWIDSANIACGGHAGNLDSMKHSIDLALEHDVRIGAHPGLCEDGGRGSAIPSPSEFVDLLEKQVLPFEQMTRDNGGRLHHIKLHGTLYHATDQLPELAEIFLDWCSRHLLGVCIYARSDGATTRLAHKKQLACWHECFLDRAYEADGSLRARTFPDALIVDPAALQLRLQRWHASSNLESHDGVMLPLPCQTFCLHSDGPHALDFAQITKRFLSTF